MSVSAAGSKAALKGLQVFSDRSGCGIFLLSHRADHAAEGVAPFHSAFPNQVDDGLVDLLGRPIVTHQVKLLAEQTPDFPLDRVEFFAGGLECTLCFVELIEEYGLAELRRTVCSPPPPVSK